jgi:hypothetical protein
MLKIDSVSDRLGSNTTSTLIKWMIAGGKASKSCRWYDVLLNIY